MMVYQVVGRLLAARTLLASITILVPAAGHAADGASSQAAEMQKLDTDHDGTVSRSEFEANADAHFKAMDKDGDGKLSQDELDAMHSTQRHNRGHTTGGGMGMGGMITTHPMQGD